MADTELPKPITAPKVLAPEIVPGGTMTGGQWKNVQRGLDQAAGAINQIIVAVAAIPPPEPPPEPPVIPPIWRGYARVITALGPSLIAPDEGNIFLQFPEPPGTNSSGADVSLFLPKRADMVGPVIIYSGDNTFYTLGADAADHLLLPDVRNGVPQSSVLTVVIGLNTNAIVTICSPDKVDSHQWDIAFLHVISVN